VYDGAYRVLPTGQRAGYARPGPGEIVRHVDAQGRPTDNWRLCCPACGKRVHVFAAQVGTADVPTFDRPLRCGCSARCGVWFRIAAGRAVPADPPGQGEADLHQEILSVPGVRPVPRLDGAP
jgi:hypothetical protein